MNLLVLGTTVLAACADPFTETPDAFLLEGVVFSKAIIPGYQVAQADPPTGCQVSDCDYVDGALVVRSTVLQKAKSALISKIDADTDAIYAAAIGNRQPEYDQAYADATAYTAPGYSGPVPAGVQTWATAKNWPPQQAAADILQTAAAWSAARDSIRGTRLLLKEGARNATSVAAVQTAQQQWAAFVTAIRGALGV